MTRRVTVASSDESIARELAEIRPELLKKSMRPGERVSIVRKITVEEMEAELARLTKNALVDTRGREIK